MSVQPLEVEAEVEVEVANVPRPRIHRACMPGTICGLSLRFSNIIFAVVALSITASTDDFSSLIAFRFLVAAAGVQIFWSFSMGILDIYALLVGHTLQNRFVVTVFAVGDVVTFILMFVASTVSSGVTLYFRIDITDCSKNNCTQFETATTMDFFCWFIALPLVFLNCLSLAVLYPPQRD